MMSMIQIVQCVPNFSEGRKKDVVEAIKKAIRETNGCKVLTVRAGEATNRSFYTFVGSPDAVLEGAMNAVRVAHQLIDMELHEGDHPRIGALDVCPFVPLQNVTMEECVALSKEFGKRLAFDLNVPVYLYGYSCREKNRFLLSSIREDQYEGLDAKLKKTEWKPDYGPATFVPRWGATITGARKLVIIYNVNLKATTEEAERIADGIKQHGSEPNKDHHGLRSVDVMAWPISNEEAQVSITLRDYKLTPVHIAFKACKRRAEELNVDVLGSEIVGLVPLKVILMAAHYYMKEEEYHTTKISQKIQLVVNKLGLNSSEEFKPEEKIIEYCMAKQHSTTASTHPTPSIRHIQLQMEHITEVWKQVDQLQKMLVQREAEIYRMHSQPQPKTTESSSFGYLRGAEVVAQRSFPLTLQAQTFEWREYGFMLHVPEGSLPPEMTQTTVDVRVSLSGQFKFPEDSDLVSATYWLSCPHKFMKPLDVEFQHCAAITDPSHCSQLSFVITKCTQKELPYTFKELEGGTFSQHSSYGRISLTHFSGLATRLKKTKSKRLRKGPRTVSTAQQPKSPELQEGIGGERHIRHTSAGASSEEEQVVEGPKEQYCAQLYTSRGPNHWRVQFVITKDLRAFLTVQQKYAARAIEDISFSIGFEGDRISLGIPANGLKLDNGWEITPRFQPVIKKAAVDSYVPGEMIPECVLVLRWTEKDKPPVDLLHKVPLLGTREQEYFMLYIESGTMSPFESSGSELSPSPSGGVSPPPPLTGLTDRPKVMAYLKKISNNQDLLMVGESLGLDGNELKKNLNSETFLFDLIGDWMSRKHRVDEVGTPTWRGLVQALEHVGQSGLASDIKKDLWKLHS